MKNNILNSIRFVFLFMMMTILNNCVYSTAFTAAASGDWSSSTTWGGSVPSFNNLGDQVTIPSGITVMLDNDYSMDGMLAQLTVNGALNSSSGTDLHLITGTLNGSGTIDIGDARFGSGAALLFAGSFTAETMQSSTVNLQVVANTLVTKTLYLSSGVLNLNSGGTLSLANNSTVEIAGGQLANSGGTLNLGSNYHVIYKGVDGNYNSGLELSGSGLKNVTVDVGNPYTLSLSNDLSSNGTLTLSTGTLNLNSHHLNINGSIASGGTGTISSNNSTSNITLVSGTGGTLRFGGSSNTINHLTLNMGGSNQANISGPLKINGVLALNSGTLMLQSADLDISGNISGTGTGSISTSGNTNIMINTPATPTGTLQFTSGNNTVNNFSVNVMNGGSINIASNMGVNGILNFTSGHIDMGNNTLTLGSAAVINGYSKNSYIITGTTGSLAIGLTAGGAATTYPVGTASLYFPASVKLNAGSNSGMVQVGVMPNVYGNGTYGTDLSIMQHVVDATWDVKSDISSNLNMDLQLMWDAAAEVNGFNRASSYIGHHTAGKWDASAKVSATSHGAGVYSLTRANITTLSPFAVFDNTSTGLVEINKYVSYELYPNPASDQLFIAGLKGLPNEPMQVEIMNSNGQIVCSLELENKNNGIPVGDLPAGVYFIKVNSSVNKFTKM